MYIGPRSKSSPDPGGMSSPSLLSSSQLCGQTINADNAEQLSMATLVSFFRVFSENMEENSIREPEDEAKEMVETLGDGVTIPGV